MLREYEDVEKEIHHLKDFIQKKTHQLETAAQNVETLKEEWLTPLLRTIEKINTNFSMYFSAMECAGEVTLAQPENTVSHNQLKLDRSFIIQLLMENITFVDGL